MSDPHARHPATRVEHDTLGEVLVPVDALWGAQTQRAVENFPISGRPIDRRLIAALGLIKGEAAIENGPTDSTTISSRSTCYRRGRAPRRT